MEDTIMKQEQEMRTEAEQDLVKIIDNRQYFTYNDIQYYVKLPTMLIEKQALKFKGQRISELVKDGYKTYSEIKKHCQKDRERYPQEFQFITVKETEDEEGNPIMEEDRRSATVEEAEQIQNMLNKGKSMQKIEKEMGLDKDSRIQNFRGESEQLLFETTAEYLAEIDVQDFYVSKCFCYADDILDEEGSVIHTKDSCVFNSFEEYMNNENGLSKVAEVQYFGFQYLFSKKK